ncbi:MAG TPA: acyl-CoA desaturase [Flavobacteriales bacterium]|nr:acyl-CoA desaturase [Flavobacteriales bacterium]HIA10707.1 acyl-CoA desaturase [Flavobacteriales bacterium]
MAIVIFIIAHWYLSLFAQTFFHHRYAAHKMFTMTKFWEKIFYIYSLLAQGASFMSPYTYGVMHRQHHAFADTEKDPHSPKYEPNLFKMMWKTKTYYDDIFAGRMTIDDKFKKDLPSWKSFERFGNLWAVRLFWVALYTAFYVFFAPYWWVFLFLPLHFVIGPAQGVVINWFAHKIGYVNFKVTNTSRNIWPFDWLMLGEGYHNNHHKHLGRANFGHRWHEIDPVYIAIWIFNKLGIIRLRTTRIETEEDFRQ